MFDRHLLVKFCTLFMELKFKIVAVAGQNKSLTTGGALAGHSESIQYEHHRPNLARPSKPDRSRYETSVFVNHAYSLLF